MAIINPSKSIDINEQLKDLEIFKHHPSAMVELTLNQLSDITDGRVRIIEPNNPIAYILSNMAILSANTIQEHVFHLKSVYPHLANEEKDLYKHMSDDDYLGRFSSPAFANVLFHVPTNDFLTKAWINPENNDRLFTIPRYTMVTIDDYYFMLPAPITVRITERGIPDVRFNNDLTDRLFPLTTDYIDYDEIRYNQEESYIVFQVRLPEIKISAHDIPISKSSYIKGSVGIDPGRKFYHIRAFAQDGETNEWIEMNTTHTEDVWDIKVPTCIVNVDSLNGVVDYYIPPVYANEGIIQDRVKLVVYTTRGEINANFRDYIVDDFKLVYDKIFPDIETNEETDPYKIIRTRAFILDKVIGGSDGKTFEQLKEDVINNNLRPNLPITNNQIEQTLKSNNLEPIRNHDVVTGREYLIKMRVPSSVRKHKVARASLDLIEFKTTNKELLSGMNSIIKHDDETIIIPRDTLFEVVRGSGLRILSKEERDNVDSLSGQRLTSEINSKSYMATYYHYVLDDRDDTTQLRAYEINKPEVVTTNFKDYNNTTLLGVNTRSSRVTKLDNGYRFDVLVVDKVFNEVYSFDNVVPFLVFTSGANRFFIPGHIHSNTVQGKVISFFIETNGYINRDDKIYVTNFLDTNGHPLRVFLDITQDLDILYCTNSTPQTYKPTEMDEILYGTYLSGKYGVVTRETHRIRFATRMERLYTRVHTSTGLYKYKTYSEDVYATHDINVYDKNNKLIHRKGDPVLDEEGKPILKHKEGENILDENGLPIEIGKEDITKYLNLLLIDYKFSIANSELTNNYKEDIRLYLHSVLTNRMVQIQEDLLERTDAYLTVPNGLVDIPVKWNGRTGYIRPNQEFKFDVYISEMVNKDEETKKFIRLAITEELDKYLTGARILKRDEIEETVKRRIRESVSSVALTSMTEVSADYIQILSDNGEVNISKTLVVTPEGYDVTDMVSVNFIQVTEKVYKDF